MDERRCLRLGPSGGNHSFDRGDTELRRHTAGDFRGALATVDEEPREAKACVLRLVSGRSVLTRSADAKTVLKFAQLEFKVGSPERGRTLFEGLVASFSKRMDLWNVYVDMEVSHGGGGEESFARVRGLFERMLGLGLNAKRSKFVFKKWLAFEDKVRRLTGLLRSARC